MKNIYDIMEEMKITRAEVEVNLCCESLTYITEGSGDKGPIGKIIDFIKSLIKKFVDFLKKIVRAITGGGGGGGGNSSELAGTYGVGVMTKGGCIQIYRGMQSLKKFSNDASDLMDRIYDAKEKFQNSYDNDECTAKDIAKYYKMQLGIPNNKELSKDTIYTKVRTEAGLNEIVEIKPEQYDRKRVDDFIADEIDYIENILDDVRKKTVDNANKMIKEIESQEEFKEKDVINLKTYINLMTYSISAYQYMFNIFTKSHKIICGVLDKNKKSVDDIKEENDEKHI